MATAPRVDNQELASVEFGPQMMRIIAISTLAACAGVHISPQASTLPAQFVSVAPGELTPDDGFFISTEGARALLLSQRMHDLDTQEAVETEKKLRESSDKRAAKSEFLASYGLPIGAGGVLLAEAVAVLLIKLFVK